MIKLAKIPLDQDLGPFSEWLRQQGVQHRIVEEAGEQVLILVNESQQEQVREALSSYLAHPELKEQLRKVNDSILVRRPSMPTGYDRVSPIQAPFVFVVIACCVLVAWLTNLGQGGEILRSLLIVNPFDISVNMSSIEGRWEALLLTLQAGQSWRLVTPDFIHFSVLHIVFNLLMFWVLGGQLEHRRGTLALIILFVVVSLASNVAQLLDSGLLFGGLSGVVYGLFGYTRVWSKYDDSVFMPEGLFRFALIWLIVGYTPLTEWLGLGRMANSAHLYGLLSGLIWGWFVFGWKARAEKARQSRN